MALELSGENILILFLLYYHEFSQASISSGHGEWVALIFLSPSRSAACSFLRQS